MTTHRAMFLSGSLGKGHDTLAEGCCGRLGPPRCRESEPSIAWRCSDSTDPRLSVTGCSVDCCRYLRSTMPSTSRSSAVTDGWVGRPTGLPWVRCIAICASRWTPFGRTWSSRCSRPAPALAFGSKRDYPPIATAVFMTDSFAHRMWVHEGTDLFLVTSGVAAASVKRYWPQARVAVVNAPVRPSFYRVPEQSEIRAELGLPSNASCVLPGVRCRGIGPFSTKMARPRGRGRLLGSWQLEVPTNAFHGALAAVAASRSENPRLRLHRADRRADGGQ